MKWNQIMANDLKRNNVGEGSVICRAQQNGINIHPQ